jgi:oligopeptide transport system substrate-binding protein
LASKTQNTHLSFEKACIIKHLFSLLFFLLSLTGCHSKTSLPSPDKKLRLAIAEDPFTLDPRKGGDALSSHVQLLLFEGLTKLHPDGTVSPAQCFSYTLSEDKKTYTFFLGRGKWSDGTKVSSRDFAQSWKAILSPTFASANAHLLYPIKKAEAAKKGLVPLEEVGIYAPSPDLFIVELERPTPYFLELISFCVFAPVPTHLDIEDPDINEQEGRPILCNGPFCLSTWIRNNEITLIKNPHYCDALLVQIPSIHLQIIRNEATALQMYENGELDLIGDPFSSLPSDALSYLPEKQLIHCPLAATTFISFNTEKPPFSNANLRQAFSLALNRDELVTSIMQQGEEAAFSIVPPVLVSKKKNVFYGDNNITLAQKLFCLGLEELGIDKKQLQSLLTYQYGPSSMNHKIAQVLEQQWKRAFGITVQLQSLDHASLMGYLCKKNYVFAQTLCRAQYVDPMNILERFQHKANAKNYPSWENAAYETLLKQSFLESGAKRTSTLEEAERLLLADMPLAPLFYGSLCYLKKPYLQGVEFSPSGGIFFERLFIAAP